LSGGLRVLSGSDPPRELGSRFRTQRRITLYDAAHPSDLYLPFSSLRHKYPLRHLSIRVPWHDSGWTGSVCKDPKGNTACLALKLIREKRDDDKGEQNPQSRANHIPLKSSGSNIEDCPSKIERTFACFEENTERVLRVELGGSTFDNLLQQLQAEFNLRRRKNPLVLGMILERAYAEGKRSPTLERIIEDIIKPVAG